MSDGGRKREEGRRMRWLAFLASFHIIQWSFRDS
jgi:hypothetical protein